MFEKELTQADRNKLSSVGFDEAENERSSSFAMLDNQPRHPHAPPSGIDMLTLDQAWEREADLMKALCWQLVDAQQDEFTREVNAHRGGGYLIRVKQGVRPILPLQACFFMRSNGLRQRVHNLIVLEEGASLNIINGCVSGEEVREGVHIGVTEILVKEHASLSYTMIHDWSDGMEVRPRTAIRVEKGGQFVSNYISIKQSRLTQSYPSCELAGVGATAHFNSLIYAPPGSHYDVGARVLLSSPETRAEIVSRTISAGGEIINRGELIGLQPGIKAHLECSGMVLSQGGIIRAIPILEAAHPDVDMSHEASVGKIAQEEISYLMARGIPEDQAVSLIVRGFLDTDIFGLPPYLRKEVDKTVAMLDNAF